MSSSTAEASEIEMSSFVGDVNPSSSQARAVSEDSMSRSDGLESDNESLTALKSSIVFWYKCLRWPVSVLAINVIVVMAILMALDNWEEPDDRTLIEHTSIGCFLFAVIAAADAVALYKASIHVERELEELERESTATQVNDNNENPQLQTTTLLSSFWTTPVQVHAKVSKRIDSFLTQRRSIPKVSFLISFLLALFGIAVSASVFLLLGGIQFQFFFQNNCFSSTAADKEELIHPRMAVRASVPKRHVFEEQGWQPVRRLQESELDPLKNKEKPIMDVPKNLQQWARYGPDSYQGRSNFVHLSNGVTFLAGQDSMSFEPHVVILHVNGTVESHEDMIIQNSFTKVVHNVSSETVGLCCEFYRNNFHGHGFLPKRILCYYDGKMKTFEWDFSSSKSRNNGGGTSYMHNMLQMTNKGDSTMWLRQEYETSSGRHRRIFSSIAKVNLLTMELTQVTKFTLGTETDDINRADYGDYGDDPMEPCYDRVTLTAGIAGNLAAAGLSYWLLKQREIPSGLVPICFMIVFVGSVGLEDDLDLAEAGIGLVCILAWLVAIRLIFTRPKWLLNEFVQEVLLWSVYSSLATCTVVAIMMDIAFSDGIIVVVLLTTVFIGLLLAHPVLTVLGGIGFVALLVLLIGGLFSGEWEILFGVVPFVAVMSSGLCSLGFYCTKYRPYLVAYSKLLLRYLMTRIHYYSGVMGGNTTFGSSRDS